MHRYTKFALYGLGIVIILVVGLQIWFVRNAKEILKTIVEEKSKGRIKLELSDVSFSVFNNRMQIKDGDITSTDSVTVPTSYHVSFNSLTLKVASFWPLILKRDLKLDSIDITSPVIEVLQWRKDTVTQNKENLSVTEEMGRIYNSMLDVLTDFGIRRIVVSNASLKLVNKIKPGTDPVWITNIYLNVLRDPTKTTPSVSKEDEVFLTSNSQTIGLPNGRHHMAFKNFKLQLFQKRIELDSCTITAVPKGAATSSYKIFFKKLLLVGVDFTAMSKLNLVRADTIFCENPIFNFKIKPSDGDKKSNPDPEKMIKELTSDLDLAFVGVKDAGIRFDFIGKRPRSVFNSNKDNFEMYGLKIRSDSSSPVSVKRFDMMVRDYHLYNVDSSAVFNFDSIHFINKKIVLNNFTVKTTPSRLNLKSIRNFKFPYFELTGLDWYKLVFDQTVVAKEALIINPIIRYTKKTPVSKKKTNFFATLQNMDSLMTLDRLEIRNGQLMLNFGKSTTLDLQQVNLKVSSNTLLRAINQAGLRRAVDFFSMSKGVLHRKDLTGQLINMRYIPDNRIYADQLLLNSASNNVNAVISGVFLDNMLIDDVTESIYADGLQWKAASVALHTMPANKLNRKPDDGTFYVKNIKGENTLLKLDNGTTTINSSVTSLRVDSLIKINEEAARASGIHFLGNELIMENSNKKIHADVDDITVKSMELQDEAKDIAANGINWNNAYVDIQEFEKRIRDKTNNGSLEFTDITGNNTRINMVSTKGTLKTIVDLVHADKISKKGTAHFVTSDLLFAGKNLNLGGKDLQASIEQYMVKDNDKSYFKNLQLLQSKDSNSINLQTPEINFTANLNSLLSNKYTFAEAIIIKPLLKIETGRHEKKIDTSKKKSMFVSVDNLQLVEPDIIITTSKNDSITTIKLPYSAGSLVTATKFTLDSNQLKTAHVKISTNTATIQKANTLPIGVTQGKVAASLSNMFHNKIDAVDRWGVTIDDLNLENLHPFHVGPGKNELLAGDISIENVNVNSDNIANLPLWFNNNSSAIFKSKNGRYADAKNMYTWSNAAYNNGLKKMQVDSFSYRPIHSKDSTILSTPYEIDFLTLNSDQIIMHDFDLENFKLNKNLSASSIQLVQPQLDIFRDKLPPDEPNTLKLLPTSMLKNLPDYLNFKEINITDGSVKYTEKDAKTRKEGNLVITRINGTVSNIKNKQFLQGDSLQANLDAYMMDKAFLNLQIRQSYLDTANGFVMKLRLEKTPVSILNPVLVPLSNVKFTSGIIDSFYINAVAREHFAYGRINMFYHDLSIKLVKNGDPNKSTFKTSLVSFLANTFVIKNKNEQKQQTIFLERMRDKSFFNYLLKITFNGMGTAVGISKSSKNKKGMKKELKMRDLPDTMIPASL